MTRHKITTLLFATGFWKIFCLMSFCCLFSCTIWVRGKEKFRKDKASLPPGLFYFILLTHGYTRTLHIHSAITRLAWLVCFSGVSFADPVNSRLRQWDLWRVLHGRHGSEIHPSDSEMSLRPSKHVWAYDWHFWDSYLVQTVLTEVLTHLRLPTHLLHPTHPPL